MYVMSHAEGISKALPKPSDRQRDYGTFCRF